MVFYAHLFFFLNLSFVMSVVDVGHKFVDNAVVVHWEDKGHVQRAVLDIVVVDTRVDVSQEALNTHGYVNTRQRH